MIKINLIPERQRIRSSPLNRILVITGAIVVGVCAFLYANLLYAELDLKNSMANTEAIYGILSQSKEKINMLSKYKQFREAKSGQLVKFSEQRVPWCSLLEELSSVLPKQVRVMSFNGGGAIITTSAAKDAAGKTDGKPAENKPAGGTSSDTKAVAAGAAKLAGNDNSTHFILNCEAESYAVVAQFIDILSSGKRFAKPVLSGLTAADDKEKKSNGVRFTVDLTVNFK